jgi:hypothetical protein
VSDHKLIAAVRKLANDHPDAIYDSTMCQYSAGECAGGEGCIIGQALQSLGLGELTLLADQSFNNVSTPRYIPMFVDLADYLPFELTVYEEEWLSEVQRNQDEKMKWRAAVEQADEVCPLI